MTSEDSKIQNKFSKIYCIRFVKIFFFLFLFAGSLKSFADSGNADSVTVSKSASKDSISIAAKKRANRMALMSAIVPGLGQIGNKKYWKLPILYAGSGALVYFITSNNQEYKKYKQALIYRNDNDSTTTDDFPRFTNDDLTVRKDYYRRNRDLSYIFAGVLYTLNIIDAYVDSQLMNFDVGDNLSIHSGGTINYSSDGIPVPSLQFVLSFK